MELVPFIKRVVEYYDDCKLDFPSIVEIRDESGLEKQEDTVRGMPYVLVEQHTNCDDCYWGYLYFPVKKRTYIKVTFFC